MSNPESSVESSVDGIHLSLLANASQRRMIRSGVFWKRFQFARRTSSRIELVKAALASRNIAFDLDPVLFGRESRDEKIIFSLVEGNATQSYENPTSGDVLLTLSNLGTVEEVSHSQADIFSILFVYLFCSDSPNYPLSSGDFGATTSGWTYHTAIAIAQSCKILNLICKFESGGKRDALIETRDDEPQVLIGAEWEWNYNDVFGKGKELEKLRETCLKHEASHAFLLTYCPQNVYSEFVVRVTKIWQDFFPDFTVPPSLFHHTITFDQQKMIREFICLKTLVISGKQIEQWRDTRFI
jgi:hypothetical protein